MILTSIGCSILVRNAREGLELLQAELGAFDQVVLADDRSTDGVEELARQAGWTYVDVSDARGFDSKRNAAIREASTDWIFVLDSDERPVRSDESLRDQCLAVITSQPDASAFQVGFVLQFADKPVLHGGASPLWKTALFRRDAFRGYEGVVHEHLRIVGESRQSGLRLYNASYDSTEHYVSKINGYTTLEAKQLLSARVTLLPPVLDVARKLPHVVADLRSGQPVKGTLAKHYKNKYLVLTLVPFYPLARFLGMYVLRQGFRDGTTGLKYATLSACYSLIKLVKFFELRSSSRSAVKGTDRTETRSAL